MYFDSGEMAPQLQGGTLADNGFVETGTFGHNMRHIPMRGSSTQNTATASSVKPSSTESQWRLKKLGPDLLSKAAQVEERVLTNFRRQAAKSSLGGTSLQNKRRKQQMRQQGQTLLQKSKDSSLEQQPRVVQANKARFTKESASASAQSVAYRTSSDASGFMVEGS